MPDITVSFEDLPLYQDAFLTAGYITGEAIVSYEEDDPSDWTVLNIEIEADGPPLVSRGMQIAALQPSHPLWDIIERALKPNIEAVIECEVSYEDPDEEHRLTAVDLRPLLVG